MLRTKTLEGVFLNSKFDLAHPTTHLKKSKKIQLNFYPFTQNGIPFWFFFFFIVFSYCYLFISFFLIDFDLHDNCFLL
ncbi:hypothetical protein ACQWG3_24675, partial [Salmonella enterica subsp. enterica serovar Infantis]